MSVLLALLLAPAQAAKPDPWWVKPLADAPPPAADRNPIDAFIRAGLSAKGLTLSPPADRATLVRRMTYDLTGLPPTPEEIVAFDGDAGALADRLLASPRYGEHWGRHWLDVVRFGESNGYERNILINNAWPFRDYVIRSFNDDKPFDRLILEHLAGDVVGKGDPDVEVGTAFLVCGPYDNVGNSDAEQAAVIRADTIDEMIRATSESFLGLTVGCARCHDHKFDPIKAADYYGLYATFAGVFHGDRKVGDKNWWLGQMKPAPGPFVVFGGGDPKRREATVSAASLSAFEASPYRVAEDAPESDRRLALARWLPGQPLTARVLANRLWHYHFGTGLIDTPSDFGAMGGKPSHPELLDWLAKRIRDGAWRLKEIHKLIVTSRTYAQASTWRKEAAAIDAESRFLWRFPPRRLAAEEVRDAMLAVAGKLRHDGGGPGFQLYQYVQDNVATYHALDAHGPETYRRAVYHQNARASRVDVMSEFDCPDPAAAAPRRSSTTTPLQALTLLNHRFTLDMAAALAQRVADDDPAVAIRKAFVLACARPPDDAELAAALPVVRAHGLRAFCRALFNSNGFLHVP